MSDLHGEYKKFMKMLKKIDFKDSDTLYIIGDVLDRGPNPIKIIKKLMEMPNVICLVGNHEFMAMECLSVLNNEITEDFLLNMDPKDFDNIINWQYNGCDSTLREFRALSVDERNEVMDYIKDFTLYEEIEVNDRKYLLVHSGIGGYIPGTDIEDYSVYDMVWERADYGLQYFDDIFVISGHTPTQLIEDNPRPGYIYRANNHIAIDCGACFKGGRLAALCLDTDKEYYV